MARAAASVCTLIVGLLLLLALGFKLKVGKWQDPESSQRCLGKKNPTIFLCKLCIVERLVEKRKKSKRQLL